MLTVGMSWLKQTHSKGGRLKQTYVNGKNELVKTDSFSRRTSYLAVVDGDNRLTRIYRLKAVDLHLPIDWIWESEKLRSCAQVAPPIRRLCGLNTEGSRSDFITSCLNILENCEFEIGLPF